MEKITVAKFGGSTIGAYIGIAEIVKRVQHSSKRVKNGARVFCTSLQVGKRFMLNVVCSLTEYDFARIKRVYCRTFQKNSPIMQKNTDIFEKCTQMLKSAAEGKFETRFVSKVIIRVMLLSR